MLQTRQGRAIVISTVVTAVIVLAGGIVAFSAQPRSTPATLVGNAVLTPQVGSAAPATTTLRANPDMIVPAVIEPGQMGQSERGTTAGGKSAPLDMQPANPTRLAGQESRVESEHADQEEYGHEEHEHNEHQDD